MDSLPPSPNPSSEPRHSAAFWPRVALALYWPLLATLTHWPRLAEDTPIPQWKLDKLVHFGAFVLLTFLLLHARPFGGRAGGLRGFLGAVGLAAAYGLIDEWTQGCIPGRTAAWDDALTNLLAIASAAATQLLWNTAWRGATLRVRLCRGALGLALPALVVAALGPMGPLHTLPVPLAPSLELSVAADKLAHFCVAAGLFWLLCAAAPLGTERRLGNLALATVVVGLSSPVVEYAQQRFDRGFEPADIVAHECGLGLGLLSLGLLRLALWLTRPRLPPAAAQRCVEAPAPDTAPAAATAAARSFVGAAVVVSSLTLLSRVTGLVRDVYLSGAFGLTGIADAFWFGFQVPNLFRRLFGEGALTTAFIPVYTDLRRADPELARRFASLCLCIAAIVVGGLTIVGELVLSGVLLGRQWSADSALAIQLTMVMLPYMPLVCLVALFGAVLQVHGRFAPSAGMPIFLNVVMVVGTFLATWGVRPGQTAAMRTAVYLVSISVVAAGVIQLVTQLGILLRHESLTTVFTGTAPYFRAFWRTFLPSLLALSVFQVNTFLDAMIAMGLSPKDGAGAGAAARLHLLGWVVDYPIRQGGLAALNAAQRLYQFPLGVFGVAIATAIFPALAHAAGEPGPAGAARFRETLRHGLRLTVFIGLPASVGLVLTSLPVARALFEHGAFGLADSHRVAWVLVGYAPAIWAYSMSQVLTRAFYALKDARTPMVLAVLMVGLNLLLNLTLVWVLGAMGLALSTAVCAAIQCLLLLTVIRQRMDRLVDRSVWRSWGRTALLTVAMAMVLAPLLWLGNPAGQGKPGVAALLAAMVAVGLGVFLGGAWLLKCEELAWLRRRRA